MYSRQCEETLLLLHDLFNLYFFYSMCKNNTWKRCFVFCTCCCFLISLCTARLSGSKDKVVIPTSSFSRVSLSDGQPSPASPSSVSTSEVFPSSPSITAHEEFSRVDPGAAGSPGSGQEQARLANRSKGQQLSHHNHKRTTSPSTRKTSRGDSKPASPKRATEGWVDPADSAQSPRKTGHGGSLEDMSRDRKAPEQRDHHSSSPMKTSKKDVEEPHSPRRPAGQQPSVTTGEADDRRYKDEGAAYRPEKGAADGGEKSWGTIDRHKRGKRVEQEGAAQKSLSHTHRERAPSDADGGTLSRRAGREKGEKEYREGRKDPRGSSSSIQDASCNGTAASKKAPITPGPWKVPSSTKIKSQVDAAYEGI